MKHLFVAFLVCFMFADMYGNSLTSRGGFSSAGSAAADRELVRAQTEQMMWMMDERDRVEGEDKARQDKASADYARRAKDKFESASADGNLTLKECIDKFELKTVEVDNLSEAKILASKSASKDSDYINKQIEASNELSLYRISVVPPFHVDDPSFMVLKTRRLNFPPIEYDKTFVLEYPEFGISKIRYYKFISLSKEQDKAESVKFEKGGMVFIEKGLDLNTEIRHLHFVAVSGEVSESAIKAVLKKHDSKIEAEEKKTKEKYGISEEGKSKTNSTQQPQKASNSKSGNTTLDTPQKNNNPAKSRKDLMKGLSR